MGKIKRERQKFHITAENKPAANVDHQKPAPKYKPIKAQLDAVENIFSGITIQLDNINKFEEPTPPDEPKVKEEKTVKPSVAEADVKPSEQTKTDSSKTATAPAKHLTKKEKMALKHQKLMEKLDVTQKARLQHKKKNEKSKQSDDDSSQTLAVSKSEFRSLLTPAAVKPSNEVTNKNGDPVPKNVFSIPLLKDDLPPLTSIFGQKSNRSNDSAHRITKKSKNIGKKANSQKSFVANYNFLKKAMAKKMK